jgi:hypothetical protein
MSDTRDGVLEAVRQQRLLLAKLQVRDDDLVKEIAALTAERDAAPDGSELREALDEKLSLLEAERGEISALRDATLAELGALDKLKGELPAMEAQALAREALAFTGADPDAAAPPTGRMSEAEARAQLAAMKAQRAAPADAPDDQPPAPPAGDDPRPPKRTL